MNGAERQRERERDLRAEDLKREKKGEAALQRGGGWRMKRHQQCKDTEARGGN